MQFAGLADPRAGSHTGAVCPWAAGSKAAFRNSVSRNIPSKNPGRRIDIIAISLKHVIGWSSFDGSESGNRGIKIDQKDAF
jgi:hypothetical protein